MDHVSATKGLPVSERVNISGARVFDGEDQGKSNSLPLDYSFWSFLNFYLFLLGAGNRYRMQQLQQQDWCEQQMREKQMRKDLQQKTNELFDQQAIAFNDQLKHTQS